MAVGTIIDKVVYISEYVFNKGNTDVTIPICVERLNRLNVNFCRIESNSMGAMFGRIVKEKARGTRVALVHNSQNKLTRIIMQSSTIINSFVFVKQNTNEYHQFMANVLSFSKEGKNKNDDAPDCLAGLAMFMKSLFKRLEL